MRYFLLTYSYIIIYTIKHITKYPVKSSVQLTLIYSYSLTLFLL